MSPIYNSAGSPFLNGIVFGIDQLVKESPSEALNRLQEESLAQYRQDCEDDWLEYWQSIVISKTQQKEKQMDKQEAAKELEVLRNKIKEIEEGLLKGDGPWRAKHNIRYKFVGTNGMVESHREDGDDCDDSLYESGNYFQTEEEAKASLIYKVLNDKWHYWVAGVTDLPDSIPDGCEVLDSISRLWKAEANSCPTQWNNSPRRWLKHK